MNTDELLSELATMSRDELLDTLDELGQPEEQVAHLSDDQLRSLIAQLVGEQARRAGEKVPVGSGVGSGADLEQFGERGGVTGPAAELARVDRFSQRVARQFGEDAGRRMRVQARRMVARGGGRFKASDLIGPDATAQAERFSESRPDPAAEVSAVEVFAEAHGDQLRRFGTDPASLVAAARRRASADPEFRASSLIGTGRS